MTVTESDLDGQLAAESAGAARLRFVPARDLLASFPPEPEGILGHYLVPGNVTILSGKPKAGKSTLALAVAEAIGSSAESFLGQPINAGPVLYVSEESAATLAHKTPTGEVHLLTRDLAWPPPSWPALLDLTAREARRTDAVLVMIDTLAHWSGFEAEKEKDAGAMQAAMRPVQGLAGEGPGVLLIVHGRKGGGEDGEGVRGSGALAGAADVILEVERVTSSPRQRALLALSRYPSTPGTLIIEHDPSKRSWAVIGESSERGGTRDIADRQAMLIALQGSDEGLTRAELEEEAGAPHLQWKGTLKDLEDEGLVRRSGAGKKGDPYRWRMLRTDSAHAPAQHCAESPSAAAPVSAALPIREQQKEADAASSVNDAPCAEIELPAGRTDAELQALIDGEQALRDVREQAP